MVHTEPFAETANVESTSPLASSRARRERVTPLIWVKSPPISHPPPGSATTARTLLLTSRRGSTGMAESAAKVANP